MPGGTVLRRERRERCIVADGVSARIVLSGGDEPRDAVPVPGGTVWRSERAERGERVQRMSGGAVLSDGWHDGYDWICVCCWIDLLARGNDGHASRQHDRVCVSTRALVWKRGACTNSMPAGNVQRRGRGRSDFRVPKLF